MATDQSANSGSDSLASPGGGLAHRGKFYGKYRGVVIDNIDLLGLGRILPYVPAVQGSILNWALPAAPYAGFETGFWAMPDIGSNVWVEFEGGNPDHPIWSGCFWEEGEAAFVQALSPEDPALIKAWRTDFITLIFNDTPEVGGAMFNIIDPAVAVPITILMNSAGIEIQCGVSNILINPEEGITLTVGPSVIAMTEAGIEITAPALNITVEGAMSAEVGGELNLSSGANLSMEAGGAAELSATGDVTIEALGAVEMSAAGDVAVTGGGGAELTAGGDVAVTGGGAAELTGGGDVAVSGGGAVEVSALGDIAISALAAIQISAVGDVMTSAVTQVLNGLVEVDGDLLIDGQQPLVI
ncbi:MAG TPA: phage baseplate assembly protein V [Thermoanaerobaculia bacterium]|nr:phage baseplate assembly protein V [Thermoanaerobaculia bacterium]